MTPGSKINTICKYVDNLFTNNEITNEEKIDLKCLLIDAVHNKLINSSNDVDYDNKTFEIRGIKKLRKDENNQYKLF